MVIVHNPRPDGKAGGRRRRGSVPRQGCSALRESVGCRRILPASSRRHPTRNMILPKAPPDPSLLSWAPAYDRTEAARRQSERNRHPTATDLGMGSAMAW